METIKDFSQEMLEHKAICEEHLKKIMTCIENRCVDLVSLGYPHGYAYHKAFSEYQCWRDMVIKNLEFIDSTAKLSFIVSKDEFNALKRNLGEVK